jgi:hypothetical protein
MKTLENDKKDEKIQYSKELFKNQQENIEKILQLSVIISNNPSQTVLIDKKTIALEKVSLINILEEKIEIEDKIINDIELKYHQINETRNIFIEKLSNLHEKKGIICFKCGLEPNNFDY